LIQVNLFLQGVICGHGGSGIDLPADTTGELALICLMMLLQ
jgi:hypothetical protein